MNNLSWFIYLADVIPNLGRFFGAVGTVFLIFSILTWIITSFAWAYDNYKGEAYIERVESAKKKFNKVASFGFFVCLIAIIIATLIPSRQTFFMIAASESAEVVVTNPKVQEIFGDLTTIIQGELKDMITKKTETGEQRR
ncbi:hypothetical protein phiOC_p387 [Ochrobactrum phage vB_OspM_OC]|nr:hypothetical protein phiOC_p387 [Ochrobactrum phage vB_OspM_OC]